MFELVYLPATIMVIGFMLLVIAVGLWESGLFAFLFTAVLAGVLIAKQPYGYDYDVLTLLREAPLYILIGLIVYFLIGTAFTVLRWRFYVNSSDVRAKLQTAFHNFKAHAIRNHEYELASRAREKVESENNFRTNHEKSDLITKVHAELKAAEPTPDLEVMRNEFKESSNNFLSPSKNKALIMFWAIWWVPSLVWFILGDSLRELGHFIYSKVGHYLETYTSKMIDKNLQ